jgi:hypothetical protein
MTLVELYKQAVEALWGKRWPLARLELVAILKPIIAEARAQALEEAEKQIAKQFLLPIARYRVQVLALLTRMADGARKEGGA